MSAIQGFLALLAAIGALWGAFQAKKRTDQAQFDADADKAGKDAAQAKTEAEADAALKELQSLDARG